MRRVRDCRKGSVRQESSHYISVLLLQSLKGLSLGLGLERLGLHLEGLRMGLIELATRGQGDQQYKLFQINEQSYCMRKGPPSCLALWAMMVGNIDDRNLEAELFYAA